MCFGKNLELVVSKAQNMVSFVRKIPSLHPSFIQACRPGVVRPWCGHTLDKSIPYMSTHTCDDEKSETQTFMIIFVLPPEREREKKKQTKQNKKKTWHSDGAAAPSYIKQPSTAWQWGGCCLINKAGPKGGPESTHKAALYFKTKPFIFHLENLSKHAEPKVPHYQFPWHQWRRGQWGGGLCSGENLPRFRRDKGNIFFSLFLVSSESAWTSCREGEGVREEGEERGAAAGGRVKLHKPARRGECRGGVSDRARAPHYASSVFDRRVPGESIFRSLVKRE